MVLSASFDMINGATEEPPQQDAAIIFLTGSIKKVNVSREVLRTLKDLFPKAPHQLSDPLFQVQSERPNNQAS